MSAEAVCSPGSARVISAVSPSLPSLQLPEDILSVTLDLFQVLSLRLRMFNISCTQQADLAWHGARGFEWFTLQEPLASLNLSRFQGACLGSRDEVPAEATPTAPPVCVQNYLLSDSAAAAEGRGHPTADCPSAGSSSQSLQEAAREGIRAALRLWYG